jgi:ABC-type sugar transport system ATPase subunit
MDVTANTTLVSLRRYMRGPLIDRRAERAAASAHVRNLGIRIGRLSDPVSTLSGGNQQKVLIAKWLESHPRVLILDEPTRGVDIGAKEEIYRLVIHLAADGMACLLISSEINELLGLCHRIGVMRNGRIVRILDAATASEQDVIEAAAAGAASHGGASGAGVVGASELPLSDSL